MDFPATTAAKMPHLASPTPRPTACQCGPTTTSNSSAQGGASGPASATATATTGSLSDGGAGEPRILLICLRGIAALVWAASRSALQRMLIAYLQSTVGPTWRSFLATAATGTPWRVSAVHDDDGVPLQAYAQGTGTVARRAANSSAKKVSWSYLRGVSLALSELCQEDRFGGGRIPLSAILDLMRQHQSAFVLLGPQVEKDVPKRLVELANEDVVFFDPFEEYVIVPEVTRQKYVLRRQQLLTEGVDPANLRMFGAALTRDLSPSKRVTNAEVASYKAQFLLAQQQRQQQQQQPHKREKKASNLKTRTALTREESLVSIADAIRPPGLRLESETVIESPDNAATPRRGHSIVMDMARVIGCQREGVERSVGASCGSRRSVLPGISAIIHQRDALEVENDRLRAILGSVD